MLNFVFRKILAFFILLIFLISLTLILQKSRSGSAALVVSGQRSSAGEVEALEKQSGENLSLIEQFGKTLQKISYLDFGTTHTGQSVSGLLWEAFGKTARLAIFAAILALLWGISLGIYGYYNPKWQKALKNLNYTLMAIPIFIIALVLLWVFSYYLQWLEPGGVDSYAWFLLPGAALGIKSGAHVYFFADEFIGQEVGKNYVKTARAFGYRRSQIFGRFIFKNMALPLISFWLLELGSYLAGAAIVEMVFSIPGIGSLLLRALMRYDLNLLIGVLVFISFIIFTISIIQEIMDRRYAGYLGLKNEG